MNGLVPVLIAVLLAEFGPRAMLVAEIRWRDAAVSLTILAAALAGTQVAPSLTGWANALLIAISLGFGALGQAQRVKPISGTIGGIVAFWQGGVPLIVFAFATRFGFITVAVGAVAGVLASAILTRAANAGNVQTAPIRWAAVAVLAVAAMVVAVGALRLA